ncbi:hypothetical protein CPB86DRAFT_830452 [Serendipita vermifera]|nr:hypothetical protein CPB86DRAFT_830452 [Serendipita vermifera]
MPLKPGINRTVAIVLFTLLGLMVLLFLFCAVRSYMRLREQRKQREKACGPLASGIAGNSSGRGFSDPGDEGARSRFAQKDINPNMVLPSHLEHLQHIKLDHKKREILPVIWAI